MTATTTSPRQRTVRIRLPRTGLLTLITTHIILSVGLLGDSAGFLAVAIRRAASDDEAFRMATREILAMFALYFGIPLSFLAALTGLALGLSTKWGILRHPWVIIKLGLIVSVIVVGATLISPVIQPQAQPNDGLLILGGTWDVAALLVAVALAVFKPGNRRRRESR